MDIIKVSVPKQDEYDIAIAPGLLDKAGQLLRNCVASNQLFIVTDRIVAELYKDKLEVTLQREGFQVQSFVLRGGEEEKSIGTAVYLIDKLVECGAHRRTFLLALGGGVITDLTGFVSSIYMRGVSYVNLPTTLLAQVDAAIGGKTAVNLPIAKNIVGTFHHPSFVIVDPNLLGSLPDSEIRHGLAEAIKVAIISSENLFTFIESSVKEIFRKDLSTLKRIVTESIHQKLDLLEPDPYEHDLRRALNFGHTIGHALESTIGYNQIAHGNAISIGMMTATRLAYNRGLCDSSTIQRIENIFLNVGLPTRLDNRIAPKLLAALSKVELIRGGALNIVLPIRIGNTQVVTNVTANELCSYISE